MRQIDHHIAVVTNRHLAFHQSFKDAETGKRVRIRESLGTHSLSKARKIRDTLYQPTGVRRSLSGYRLRRELAVRMQLLDATGQDIASPTPNPHVRTSVPLKTILDEFCK